jgi:diguanylate cyclase (GGDEF)-like protein
VANRLVQLTIKGNIKWALASYMSMHFKNEPAVLGWLYDITERKKLADEEHYQALFDPLTKLPNRRMLGDRLTLAMQAGKRSHHIGALMFLDMDNFKPLNDQHGHAVGDMLLVEVARRINLCVREVDTVARFGGDEFVVVLSELTTDQAQSADYAMMIAEKIRAQLAAPYRFTVSTDSPAPASIEHSCSVSIGVTLFNGTDITIEAMLKQADTAMYQAKMSGRNAIRRFEP